MVKYETIIKVMDELVKCKVTLKGVKGAIKPTLDRWQRETGMSDETRKYIEDRIARFYRDSYNNPEGHTENHHLGIEMQGMKMIYNPDDSAMPTSDEFKELAGSDEDKDMGYLNTFLVKADKNGLTMSYRSGDVDTHSASFSGPVFLQNDDIQRSVWDNKYDNGVEDLWQGMKSGKISKKECNDGIKKVITKTQGKALSSGSKYLTNQWKQNGVPMDIQYVEIEKRH